MTACFLAVQIGYWSSFGYCVGFILSYLVDHGISNTGLSIAVLGYQGCSFLGSFVWGEVCDRMHSNRRPILMSAALTTILMLLMPLARGSLAEMALIYTAIGFLHGPIISCIDAWIMRSYRGNEGAYGRIRAVGPLAFAIGSFIQGRLILRYGYDILAIGGVISMLVLIIASLLLSDTAQYESGAHSKIGVEDVRSVLRHPVYAYLLVMLILTGLSCAPVNNLKASILKGVGGDVSWVGMDNLCGIIMQVPFLFLAGRISRIPYERRYLAMTCLPGLMLILDILAAHPALIVIGTCANNIAYAIQIPTMRAVTEETIPERHRNLGHTLMDAGYGSMAGMMSALYSGVLSDMAGMRALFVLCLIIDLAACAMAARYCMKRRRELL